MLKKLFSRIEPTLTASAPASQMDALNFDWGFRMGYVIGLEASSTYRFNLRNVLDRKTAACGIELYRSVLANERAGYDAAVARAREVCDEAGVMAAAFVANRMLKFRWSDKLLATTNPALDWEMGVRMGCATAQFDTGQASGQMRDVVDPVFAGCIVLLYAAMIDESIRNEVTVIDTIRACYDGDDGVAAIVMKIVEHMLFNRRDDAVGYPVLP
ncbi:hypothetical protein [Paraburkholderia sp. MM6662-R1]|uniref:hypothetical protein n=1 Tax=Paraburkholderia sp. MM6662-R1 TaxID=2991066 RepID=UPI003D24BFEF